MYVYVVWSVDRWAAGGHKYISYCAIRELHKLYFTFTIKIVMYHKDGHY